MKVPNLLEKFYESAGIPVTERPGMPETVTTGAAAALLNRKPQTLYKWACHENGPLRPVRINGRLAWHVSDIKRLLKGGS